MSKKMKSVKEKAKKAKDEAKNKLLNTKAGKKTVTIFAILAFQFTLQDSSSSSSENSNEIGLTEEPNPLPEQQAPVPEQKNGLRSGAKKLKDKMNDTKEKMNKKMKKTKEKMDELKKRLKEKTTDSHAGNKAVMEIAESCTLPILMILLIK
uniref:Uncharacterized protein n=1 Tax=Strongyloides stercoralis TaxID=6248 RepID=A0AAF5DSB4_STRER